MRAVFKILGYLPVFMHSLKIWDKIVPDSAFDSLLPAWSSLESTLRFSFICTVSRAFEQRRSLLQLLLIIFTHLFICFAVEKKIRKEQKLRSGGQYLNCFGPVNTLF